VAEEGVAEVSVAAYAVEALVGDVGGGVDGVGAEVGQFFGFEAAPDVFDGIEVMGVAG
jgi:hypothetical protein